MVEWHAEGVVLDALKFGDHDAIVTVFTAERGVCKGVLKAAMRPKQRLMMEPGNRVEVRWNARLADHLGSWHMELQEEIAGRVMADRLKLTALGSVCALLKLSLAEHDPHPRLYDALMDLLQSLQYAENWPAEYVRFELALLEESGFGLDLHECAATGSRENLHYISPKSGRAVSAEAGKAYHDRMLPFAAVLSEKATHTTLADIADGLRVTGHFIHHWLLSSVQKTLPPMRLQFAEILARKA